MLVSVCVNMCCVVTTTHRSHQVKLVVTYVGSEWLTRSSPLALLALHCAMGKSNQLSMFVYLCVSVPYHNYYV